MAERKGLGKNKGKGYYNIIQKDSRVHSQSAKGFKQPQRLQVTLSRPKKESKKNPNLPKDVFNKILEENEMKLLKKRLNDGKITVDEIQEKQSTFKLAKKFQEKGKEWLINLWKTETGKERKNNPFGNREKYVLDNFDRIEVIDFWNNVNSLQLMNGINNYQPVYRVYSKDSISFDYWVGFRYRSQKNPINIIG